MTSNLSALRRFAIVSPCAAFGQCAWFTPHARRIGLWVRSNGDTYASSELVPCRSFTVDALRSNALNASTLDARNLALTVLRRSVAGLSPIVAVTDSDLDYVPAHSVIRSSLPFTDGIT